MQSVCNNNSTNRVCSLDYETPIIIPMGSNPNNPFAKDEPEFSKKEFGFGDIVEFIVTAAFLGLLLSIVYSISKETKRSEEKLNAFENNGTIWCKPGYDINSEIRVLEEMFVNERMGVRVKYNTKFCK